MNFLDRRDALQRLMRLSRSRAGGLAVIYGRRRAGKIRLLLEWVLPARFDRCEIHRALFVPALRKPVRSKGGIHIVTSKMLLS